MKSKPLGAKMNPVDFQIQTQHCLQPTDLFIMQCSRSQLYLSQWGKYFHKTLSLWSSFQLKSVSLTRGQRELQDSCCWRRNVLNETWDWAAGIEDHRWETLTYEGPETLKRYFYFTFPGQMLLWVVLLYSHFCFAYGQGFSHIQVFKAFNIS